MEIKQNQTFFHGTYSSLTPYLFLSKNIKVFQWLPKSKFTRFVTIVDPNIVNETKSDISSWDIFKSGISFHWWENIITFITDIFQFHCKSKHKYLKWNEIKGDMCKSDSPFPYLQSSILFKVLLMREPIYTYSLSL